MIACAQCKTTNTLDSQFCRRCGTALSADVLVQARAELDALVAKGTQAFEDGRVDDALAIAEEAVHTDPTHANAHALKGMAHERRGEVAKALEAYERVCDLQPDSALDRLKLTGLRAALAERATAVPDRRTPLLAGASAAVLLACVGIAAAKLTGGPAPIVATSGVAKGDLVAQAQSPAKDAGSGLGNDLAVVQKAPTSQGMPLQEGDVPPVGEANGGATGRGTASPTVSDTPTRSGSLPAANARRSGGLSGSASSLPPMEITPAPLPGGQIGGGLPNPAETPSRPSTPATPRPRTGPGLDPTPTPQGDPTPQPTTPRPGAGTGRPKSNDGVIDIRLEGGSGGQNGGSAGGNGAEALSRVGKAHAQAGDFNRAAQALERALAAGADPAATNQRLGQAYERLGRKSDAKAAYGRSAAGYRTKIQSGKAGERDKNGLDSVNQAMKVLDRG